MTHHKQLVKPGVVLVSQPFMDDPSFKRSVVLLCDHNDEGSVGFVLNKPINMKVNDLVADFPDAPQFDVYYGGPVSRDTIHYVHNVGDLLEDSVEINKGLYWGGNFDKMKFLIDSNLIQPFNVRFFVGYSGWSAGQLPEEMDRGSWIVGKMDQNYAFKNQDSVLWKEVLDNKGDQYSVIARMPDNSHNN